MHLLLGGDVSDICRCPPDFTPVVALPAESALRWKEVLHSVLEEIHQNSTMGNEYLLGFAHLVWKINEKSSQIILVNNQSSKSDIKGWPAVKRTDDFQMSSYARTEYFKGEN